MSGVGKRLYSVNATEEWLQEYQVRADSAEEALSAVAQMKGSRVGDKRFSRIKVPGENDSAWPCIQIPIPPDSQPIAAEPAGDLPLAKPKPPSKKGE
jgi:hypothetical protein